MNISCSNQDPCPVILDSKCVIYEGENLLYIGVNTNDNYRYALQQINTKIADLVLSGGVNSFNARTGIVTLTSSDVTTALGYTPADASTFVPYTGATQSLNLGSNNLSAITINNISVKPIGQDGVALGENAAANNIGAAGVTAVGYLSLFSNTTGIHNTGLGPSSLADVSTGSGNTGIGSNSLADVLSSNNTGVGFASLINLISGDNNIGLGVNAAAYFPSENPVLYADSSIFIGCNTYPQQDNQSNQIVIGDGAVGLGSNTVAIGNSSIIANYFNGSVNGGSFVKSGGTSSEFLKADGSVDSSTYITSGSLSGLVPYTGATANVDLGIRTLNAALVAATTLAALGSGSFGGAIMLLKGTATFGNIGDANSINAVGNKYVLISDAGSTNYKSASFELGSLTNNTERILTLPDANGTIALTSDIPSTSTLVPYTGATGAVNLGAYDLTVNGITIGLGAGSSVYNNAFGFQALYSNTSGSSNAAFGVQALYSNMSGAFNTAFGNYALNSNTSGFRNTALGLSALLNNSNGDDNMAFGYQSLLENTSGSKNTAIGTQALFSNTGSNNTAIGDLAGSDIITGSNNTIIGRVLGNGSMLNNVILADGAGNIRFQFDGTNTLLGQSGNVGIGVAPSYQLQLSTDDAAKPTSALWTIASDQRIKENITPYTKGLAELLLINPINYDYNGKGGFVKGKGGVGVIAQEIQSILPNSVSSINAKLNETDEEETNILNFNGHELIYVLINSIKELKAEIEQLKNK